MRYAFDPAKQAANVAKHGIWFGAAEDFEWETAQIEVDGRKNYAETRLNATGLIGTRLFVLTFTLRETAVRLISLRKANQREVHRYVRQAT
ncbi:uncharacterized DUF497 family protein [Paucibacter oligotrophus]|uniref:Uncharacterized DUF497 family protein n=1 Tax=Roseateles oligotrophus TaxID=1769250 RepID=A0A840L7N9_9BURK|nr:BrnT family toxin [Roseateles oligotrophus]MBB4842238.1 uncharacterized DUF497 family protein [Roseateles oligotrophus]